MDWFKKIVAEQIARVLEEITEQEIRDLLEIPRDASMGDLSFPCFTLAKKRKASPAGIARELEEGLHARGIAGSGLIKVSSQTGYVNFSLDHAAVAEAILPGILESGERYGAGDIGAGKTVVIDFSSPNIAKPFHVGHLRSTVIGSALYRIYSYLGYRCVGINHLGDWGTQFGKLITAYLRWGTASRLEEAAIDELLGLYVRFHEEADKDPALEDEAREWFVKMEQGDEEAKKLWRRFVDVSLAEFQKIYDRLGVRFDFVTGESFYNEYMDDVVRELREKRLLEEDEGAWLVRLEEYGMPPALILKKDGSSLYPTRDIAAALYRKRTFGFHKALYVTDYSQSLHFSQWFKVIERMGYGWASELVHVPFGRVSLEGEAMSTRRGKVVRLEEVLDQAVSKIREIIEEKNPKLENKEEVARQVGVGAVIFNDLRGNRIKDIDFSWKEALSFEGETGPYVQYTYARACSVLRMGTGTEDLHGLNLRPGIDWDPQRLSCEAEFRMIKQLGLFPEVVGQAAAKLEPSLITRYLVDTAQAFNRFYHDCPILKEEASLRIARLALVQGVRITLKTGLGLIGLQAPERM
ncbi:MULTISPECIES: arginine--tRNA ligase [Paenibacillus]|uniref:arginine--tRNA ligase n=1 Tax=Paenibacillus TaxID=44249 RepID=UPI002FE05C1D